MPYTINGIGTHYYGKKHEKAVYGRCSACGYQGNMLEYETGLYFVVLYIPLIPLGKKQIFDYCPKCRRHAVMPLEKWNTYKNNTLEKVLAENESRPDDPESALSLFETLIEFNHYEEANLMASKLEKTYPGHWRIQYTIGARYFKQGDMAHAGTCFERAFCESPSHSQVRSGLAMVCIHNGELSRAKELLIEDENSYSGANPVGLLKLGLAFQKQGNHLESMDVFRFMVGSFPAESKTDTLFRKAVMRSEKALDRKTTILPKVPINQVKLVVSVLLVLALLMGSIMYFIQVNRQKLYLINPYSTQAVLSMDSREPVIVDSGKKSEIFLPEGEYTVKCEVNGWKLPEETMIISNSIMERFLSKNTFVFNIGGGAVLLWEKATYRVKLKEGQTNPYELHYGKAFYRFKNIDYLFAEFPKTIRLKDSTPESKTRLSIFDYDPQDLIVFLQNEGEKPEKLMLFLEGHILGSPEAATLISQYVYFCAGQAQLDHAQQFFNDHIDDRPVRVEIHRNYQALQVHTGAGLTERYDSFLEKEPENSDLQYLRGRLETGITQSMAYYNKAIDLDSENAFAWNAKGFGLLARGNFEDAKKCLEKAVSLAPLSENNRALWHTVQLASGAFDELKLEGNKMLKKNPASLPGVELVLEAIIASGREDEIQGVLDQFTKAARSESPADHNTLIQWVNLRSAYLRSDFEAYDRLLQEITDQEYRETVLRQGALARFAIEIMEQYRDQYTSVPYPELLFYIGRSVRGRRGAARDALAHAIELLSAGTAEEVVASRLLREGKANVLEIIDNISLHPDQKRVLLTALAIVHPHLKTQLLTRASRMNISFTAPRHFLDHAIEQLSVK
jgi:tetratricopeptide (TPR) repeat protein